MTSFGNRPIIDAAERQFDGLRSLEFDPDRHIDYQPPVSLLTWENIGFPKDHGVAPVCATQPFRLFSEEAVRQMRSEILQPDVLNCYTTGSNIAALQVRGFAAEHAPFICKAWKHPQTLEILSGLAGLELSIKMDYEIAHVNLSATADRRQEGYDTERAPSEHGNPSNSSGIKIRNPVEDEAVVGWHKDSYPYTCTLMLSDCTNMTGGAIVLQRADGSLFKMQRPQMGEAILLQGRYIVHEALKASGSKERMTMAASLWPRSPYIRDDTFLTRVRAISDTSQIYSQYAVYRLDMLRERIEGELSMIRGCKDTGRKVDTKALKEFISVQEAFLRQTNDEILEDDKIVRGLSEEIDVRRDAALPDLM